MTLWLRSALFNAAFWIMTVALALALVPALLLPRGIIRGAWRGWARATNRLLTGLVGASIEVRGLDHVPAGACIVASKHQSAWETIALGGLLADPCMVVKRELFLVPVFGWLLHKQGHVRVDRGAGSRALRRLIKDGERARAAARQIVIFPEGTRTAPGESRGYQPGVAALYGHLGVPVVPVALNSGLAWRRQSFLRRPARIIAEFLEPIPPGLARAQFTDRLRTAIEGATRALEAEAGLSRTPTRSAAA
jgi:1-acyl-sn-glycerol-3-phosphate acyltransferase